MVPYTNGDAMHDYVVIPCHSFGLDEKSIDKKSMLFSGLPYRTRTCRLQNRNLTLYPDELREDVCRFRHYLFFFKTFIRNTVSMVTDMTISTIEAISI